MRKEELFDLLGEIDDKFYEEAHEDDPVMPIKIDTAAFRRPWWQVFATAAASVAVVAGMVVGVVALKNSGFIHYPDTSDTSNEPNNSGDPSSSDIYKSDNISTMDLYECNVQLMNKYGEQSSKHRIMDLNCDGKDEIVMLMSGANLGIHVFSKIDGEMVETGVFAQDKDRSFLTSLDDLYEYEDENGEHYWYYGFRYQNGGMYAEVAAAVKYDSEEYNVEYLLSYGTLTYEGTELPKQNFYRIGWNYSDRGYGVDYNDVSNVEFYGLWNKYPELREMDREDYLNDGFDGHKLENFPMIDMAKVPDLDPKLAYLFGSLEMRAATIDAKKWGQYELRLLGEFIHTESDEKPGVLYVESLYLALCKNGEIIKKIWFHNMSMASAGGRERYLLDVNKLDGYLEVFELDGGTVAVFNYDLPDYKASMMGYENESTFIGIVSVDMSDRMDALMGNCAEIGGASNGYNIQLSHELTSFGNTIRDVANGIDYTFDFESIKKSLSNAPVFDSPHFTASYEGSTSTPSTPNTAPKTETFNEYVIDADKIGDYTVKLIGYNVTVETSIKNVWMIMTQCTQIKYSDVFVVVEQNGEEIYRENVTKNLPAVFCETEDLSDYVRPFEMKDGIGFVLYSDLDPYSDVTIETCHLFMLKDGKPVELEFIGIQHFATQISRSAEINFNANSIAYYVIDFSNGTYDELAIGDVIVD